MKIGVISDTHDRLATIDSALTFFSSKKVKLVVHCGDWKSIGTTRYFVDSAGNLSLPVRGVLGNNDIEVDKFLSISSLGQHPIDLHEGVMRFICEGRKVAVYHGHHRPTLNSLLSDNGNDILLLGHTHKPRIEKLSDTLIVNPGSTAFSIPRSKAWVPTVAIVDTDMLEAQIHQLLF